MSRGKDKRGPGLPQPNVARQRFAWRLRFDTWRHRWWQAAVLVPLPGAIVLWALLALQIGLVASADHWVSHYARRGGDALNNGKVSVAVLCYTRLVQLRPEDPEFRLGLAQCYFALGHHAQAGQLLQMLVPAGEVGYPPARLWQVRLLLDQQEIPRSDLDRAHDHLNQIVQAEPDHAEAHSLLCELHLVLGASEPALEHLNQSPELARPQLRLRLARLLSLQGNWAAAREHAQRAAEPLLRGLNHHPDMPQQRRQAAEAIALCGRFAAAEAMLIEGYRQQAHPELASALAGLYLAWADPQNQDHQFDDAARHRLLEQSAVWMRRVDDSPASHAHLARVLLALQRFDEAEPHLRAAQEAYPQLRLELARLLAMSGRTAEARQVAVAALHTFLSVLYEQPANHTVRLLAADAAYLLDLFEMATEVLHAGLEQSSSAVLAQALTKTYLGWFDRLPELQPGDYFEKQLQVVMATHEHCGWHPELIQRWIGLRRHWPGTVNRATDAMHAQYSEQPPDNGPLLAALGMLELEARHVAVARRLLHRAVELDPSRDDVVNALAWSLANEPQPDLPQALATITQAINRATKPPPSLLVTRGLIYSKLECWEDARSDLERCRSTFSGRASFHAALADIYSHLNQHQRAAEEQRRAGVDNKTIRHLHPLELDR